MTPPYVPPHLEGKVTDFRQEPNGDISFRHDEMANGLSDPELTRKKIDQTQYKQTFDRDYRLKNFNESILKQYGGPDAQPKSYTEELKGKLVEGIRKGLTFGTSSGNRTLGTVGLLSALAGGGLGAYAGARSGDGVLKKGLLYALLAGALGTGGMAYMQAADQRRRNYLSKQASSPEDVIIAAVTSAGDLSQTQKADILRAIINLQERDRYELSRLIRTAVGAGVGTLVTRFLVGKGLLSSAVGGILGALIGAASARPSIKYNALGQVSISNYR